MRYRTVGGWLTYLLIASTPAHAQHYSVAMTLVSPTPTHDEYFGSSVGVAADVIAVGSTYLSGKVYVFDAAAGTLRYVLTPPPGRTTWFGQWLAGVGSYLVISDPAQLAPGPGAVFVYDAATGTLLHTIDGTGEASIGLSVVPAGGNVLVSGGPDALLIDPATGDVLQTFPSPYDSYGEPVVASDGTTVVIGSPNEAIGNLGQAGRARLYDAASGALLHTLASPTPVAQGDFGRSVAIVGGLTVVRAYNATGRPQHGYVLQVFDTATGAWVRTIDVATSPGSWMAPFGSTLVVGGFVPAPWVLHRVDPAAGSVLATVPDGGVGYSIAPLGDRIVAGDPYAHDEEGAVYVLEPCGNGIVAGEECDDGNTVSGDGCSAECIVELCGSMPAAGCDTAPSGGSSIGYGTNSAGETKLAWKWRGPGATDFGSPPTTTSYTLCLYEHTDTATPELVTTMRAPAGGICGRRPCWRQSATGFGYHAPSPGVTGISLRAVAGSAKMVVKGSGPALGLPTTPLAGRATVQLRRLGAGAPCWEAHYSAPRENTGFRYKARSD
ncbi:MAG TPA: hypothetical protein VKA21_06835 [Candidatus Binatia bacterium]|nr:hypothetical protein [Candidatus Binatia bacterium]